MADEKCSGDDVQAIAKKSPGAFKKFGSRLLRKKFVDENVMETNLRRCLTTVDMTMLAIGHMVGSGVYVLTPTVAKDLAGPAIVLAYLLSGVASFLAALCYAELGVRYPRSGSAYSYTYLALGEFWAFIVGWNVALEHVIGSAATARACSAYIDSLAGGIIKNATENLMGGTFDVPFMSDRLDFLAFGIMMFFTICLSFGVKITSHINNLFSVTNLIVIAIVIGVGSYFSDTSNWTNPEAGGFMPYGFSGVLAASASCFYAYVGFDSIAASGEETKNPQKSIPRATMISMGVATATYVAVATVLTLMIDYRKINNDSGLPDAFEFHGAHWAKMVVIVGALCGMATAIIGALFALTRIIYVMADDGLLFPFCSTVNSKTKIPLGAMYTFASFAAIMSLILDVNTLVELMSIGTLFAYLVVSASVIILRYQPDSEIRRDCLELFPWMAKAITLIIAVKSPGRLVTFSLACFTVFTFITCAFATGCFSSVVDGEWWAVAILAVLLTCVASSFVLILMHKQSNAPLKYKVPLAPLFPALSVAVNILLIVSLKAATWIRLAVWVSVGLSIYLFYGIRHSKLETPSSQLVSVK
ncbi:Cationic amino acid transporter 4 like protein [Argiope bruennichi]|uniref:Cationic amino acid transporter 4 like protein n=1 Tax=Argiope bruennichi TaxID=94029 RepID=A0A8T0FV76_ARGBR|nr:Cationic amino acid transporter 4 like protein [Argiope bruennichi]